ncbi:unnamed protein product [Effrenium voratum]|uniref:Uncharacterized protein n=1 Tax=Effrenium voratum TaxID=2562239 RepID=A0AA36IUE3_9DINO|nr:unnamed protein product [Effrenium voratum]
MGFTDEGCFPQLTWRGFLKSAEASAEYGQKGCPFSALSHENRVRRQLLLWYRSHAFGCFVLLSKEGITSAAYKNRHCPSGQTEGRDADVTRIDLLLSQRKLHGTGKLFKEGVPPFSVSDMAQACLAGMPHKFNWHQEALLDWVRLASCGQVASAQKALPQRGPAQCHCNPGESVRCQGEDSTSFPWPKRFQEIAFRGKSCWCERTGDVLPWWLQPSELCNTFLQLPLMFDGIGFDKSGIMWENPYVRNIQSFFGRVVHVGSFRRVFEHHCKDKILGLDGDLGSSMQGRLVLRALLPSYYRHVYARNIVGVVRHGVNTGLMDDAFDSEVAEVCSTPHSGLDGLLSYQQLRAGHLLSPEAMDRDAAFAILYGGASQLLSPKTLEKYAAVIEDVVEGMQPRMSGFAWGLAYRNNTQETFRFSEAIEKIQRRLSELFKYFDDLSNGLRYERNFGWPAQIF